MADATPAPIFLILFIMALALTQPHRALAARGGRSLGHNTSGQTIHRLHWTVERTIYSKNCQPVAIPTVNGQFPGPTLHVNEGDRVIVTVTNKVTPAANVTLHWHGIKQRLNNWADGPDYITQCPLRFGDTYVYDFNVTAQYGTLFWHGHTNWLRATVHGAFIIRPTQPPPWPKSKAEIPILFGEWFPEDPNAVERGLLQGQGGAAVPSTANLINGQPGPLYNCSSNTTILKFQHGKTYLLQIINAALNNNLFFKIANHTMMVVAADGMYVKPFSTSVLMLSPGQTTEVLVKADQPKGEYFFGVREWDALNLPLPPLLPGLGIIQYIGHKKTSAGPILPIFPATNDSATAHGFDEKLKGLTPYTLPDKMDREFFFVVGIANAICAPVEHCNKTKIAATINNVTFVIPSGRSSILNAYYHHIKGVYTTNFPPDPSVVVQDYLSQPVPAYNTGVEGTRVIRLKYNQTVQIVLQNVNELGLDDHPFHLHGHDFYVIAQGFGNYNAKTVKFNLVDPPMRNTMGLPEGGWLVIRFQASNPGVWLYHCHIERHMSWGMMMVFITENGKGPNETLPGPLHPQPKC